MIDPPDGHTGHDSQNEQNKFAQLRLQTVVELEREQIANNDGGCDMIYFLKGLGYDPQDEDSKFEKRLHFAALAELQREQITAADKLIADAEALIAEYPPDRPHRGRRLLR